MQEGHRGGHGGLVGQATTAAEDKLDAGKDAQPGPGHTQRRGSSAGEVVAVWWRERWSKLGRKRQPLSPFHLPRACSGNRHWCPALFFFFFPLSRSLHGQAIALELNGRCLLRNDISKHAVRLKCLKLNAAASYFLCDMPVDATPAGEEHEPDNSKDRVLCELDARAHRVRIKYSDCGHLQEARVYVTSCRGHCLSHNTEMYWA